MGNRELSLLIVMSFMSMSTPIVFKKEHSFTPPFEGHTDIFRNWYFTGAASLHESLVRLTPDEPMVQGAVWCAHASFMKDWEIQVHFRIFGKEPVKYGDGIAIWYTKEALNLGPVFGNKDHFTGLGIFIDTHENITHPHQHKHPYVSAVINNGSMSYKHDEKGTLHQLGGCHVQARNQPQSIPTAVAISYMQNTLTVFTDTEGLMQWVPCIRVENVYLPSGYFFGVSASTSWNTDFHDVMTVSTLDMTMPEQQAFSDESTMYSEVHSKSDVVQQAEELVVSGELDRIMQEMNQQVPPLVQEGAQHFHQDPQMQEQIKDPVPPVAPKEFVQEEQKKTLVDDEPKKEKIEEEHVDMSWLKLIMYTTGIVVVAVILIRWFINYNVRRKERLRKRLY